ncbi:MAG: hypothetical protein ACRDKB_02265 [Actinomycetota bacterium]
MAEPPGDWKPLLGRKVSVRYRLREDPEHPFSEAIGIVQSVDGKRIEIINRRGEIAAIDTADVLAAKIFPA